MCFNCSDFIDMCWAESCYNPNGGKYRKARSFYLDDKYCEHMKEKYGHSHAIWEDRYGVDDEEEED